MTTWLRRRDTGRIVFVVPLVTCALGLLAAGAIWARESSQARQRDLQAANQVATALAQAAGATIEGLRAASAMVADDEVVSPAELTSFGTAMERDADLRAVAVAVVVADADRAAFEAERGYDISDIGPDGDLVRAPQRPTYTPIVAVQSSANITPAYGFDVLGDPIRGAAIRAADASGVPSLSAPVEFVGTQRTGYLAATALRRPDGEVVGFVTGSFSIDDVLEAARAAVDPATTVAVIDGGTTVAGTADDGMTRAIAIGGRTIEVRADEATPVNIWPALAVAVGAVLASVALAVAISRLRRSERAASQLATRLDDERTRALHLADLGRDLTAAATRDEVVALLTAALPAITGADEVTVAFVDGALLRTAGGTGLVPLDTHLPTTEAVRSSRVVTVVDVAEYQRAHPDLIADAKSRHVRSAAAVPLVTTRGASFGVVGMVWGAPHTFTPGDESRLAMVGALAAGTVQRVDGTEAAMRHADSLARLAEELALATTIDQVVSASASHLPAISDAADVRIELSGESSDTGERHLLTDTSGGAVGELVVAWPGAAGPDAEQQERLRAAIGLIEETVRRVDIQRSTSEALLSLRQRLLRPLPSPAGLDLAARYRPTSRPLGMGGDWYDVIERPDGSIGIVIGDVVGHGISAIATMIHVSTILGGLVRAGTPVEEIVGRAARMLDAHGMVATAQVLLLDPAAEQLAMISAGHPPPLLRLPRGGVLRLPDATHAPLGVGDGSGDVVRVAFPPGAAVLGYTDGLVERRDEPIDLGIGRLADVFATTNGSVWGAISQVLQVMAPDGRDHGDDVAVVVAQHSAAG